MARSSSEWMVMTSKTEILPFLQRDCNNFARNKPISDNTVSSIIGLINAVPMDIQGAPKNFTPWGFLIIFLKQLRIFKQNFTRLLSIQIYANLQNFIQLSPTLTKLCRIKRHHSPNFYISQHIHHEFY